MLTPNFINDLTQHLTNALPNSFNEIRNDMEKTINNILQQTFAKLDLVTREEFDVQTEVLAQTRLKLEKLLQQVETLEKEDLRK